MSVERFCKRTGFTPGIESLREEYDDLAFPFCLNDDNAVVTEPGF
ncbi:hypothetical protein BN137_1771 [Cronobacter condimenti 1330]|uniref:Uncharacterized protein n=1 Tax=Cronobacter condimenti 1330 TaxID=1073999 RepID=K7ZZT1_9ENTR|nr:hypothetical protein BN137_1771 [Cronobacter condimenti 1330]